MVKAVVDSFEGYVRLVYGTLESEPSRVPGLLNFLVRPWSRILKNFVQIFFRFFREIFFLLMCGFSRVQFSTLKWSCMLRAWSPSFPRKQFNMSQFGHHVPNEQKVQALQRGQNKKLRKPANVIVYEICLQLFGEHSWGSYKIQSPAECLITFIFYLFIFFFFFFHYFKNIAIASFSMGYKDRFDCRQSFFILSISRSGKHFFMQVLTPKKDYMHHYLDVLSIVDFLMGALFVVKWRMLK